MKLNNPYQTQISFGNVCDDITFGLYVKYDAYNLRFKPFASVYTFGRTNVLLF